MNRILYQNYLVVLMSTLFSALPLSAQTELTTEMVWQEGTHWIYPVFIPYDYDGTPLNITYLHECRLVKRYYEEFDDYYLVLEHRTNEDGAWRDNWRDYCENLKVEGNKVYEFIISGGHNGQPFEITKKYLIYDFDSWVDGGNAYFEYENMDHILSVPNFPLDNMQQIVTDPEGKYYSYAFSGEYSIAVHYDPTPYYIVKSIGRLIDENTSNLVYSQWPLWYLDAWRMFGIDGIKALKIWHPDLGVLYQHPDYEKYAGIKCLHADEAGEAVVTTGSGEVTVESAQPVEVMICTTTGVTVRRDRVTGSATYPLAPGIYIVRAGTRTSKVCI